MYSFLIENISLDFGLINNSNFIKKTKDSLYIEFMNNHNGGYFYNNSLHLYGISTIFNYHDINSINSIFSICYGGLVDNLFFFGEDIFGNPFGFNNQGDIIHFNLESADKEKVAHSFEEWLKVISADLNYFTGKDLVKYLNEDDKNLLGKGKRYTAKYPFILGGKYTADNLILKDYKKNLEYNSSIAKQVYDLPDGSSIEIKILNNES